MYDFHRLFSIASPWSSLWRYLVAPQSVGNRGPPRPKIMLLKSALEALGPLLVEILNVTSTPGISVGVLHHGAVVHTANYGFRDIERQLVPDTDTSWLICSITKAITASMVAMMVDEQKLNLTTQLHDIFPQFQRTDAQANITIADLMSHRTGIAPYDGIWYSSDNQIPLDRSQAIPILSYAPAAAPLRTAFLYNNIAYEAIGQVLEKVSGSSYLDLLHERVIKPLKLNRTFYAQEPNDDNTAKSYAALSDGSAYEIQPWGYGKNLMIGPGGAIRSSISDMLVLYKALMDAGNAQVTHTDADNNPFKLVPELLEARVQVPSKTLREYSYAFGWIRGQLPNILDISADYVPPVLGKGAPSRLMIHHQGYIAGNVAYVALFPETTSAVIVTGNSAGLTDAMRLLGQMIIETLFENDFNSSEYLEIARTAGKDNIEWVSQVHRDLVETKTACKPVRPLSAYVGKYYNSIGNYFIEIKLVAGELQVAYLGKDFDTFPLETYQADSFFWWLDYDESAKRARLPGYPKEYFTLKFGCPTAPPWWHFGGEVEMACLTWKHEYSLPGEGEVFRKRGASNKANASDPGSQHQQQYVFEGLK